MNLKNWLQLVPGGSLYCFTLLSCSMCPHDIRRQIEVSTLVITVDRKQDVDTFSCKEKQDIDT